MRFLYAKLTGYVGIYNGLGLTELEIDFSKSKYKVCTISGPNGCGKSTLLNALNILPDGNENFVPSLPASKQLRIFDEGMVYDIFINHPLDGKGNRSVTKVSIKKNGLELNPNGNVSSYKDIIFNEFDLDSNFITLTHLSGDDRGLADKKPAERKKFLASITTSLETYNGIYKNLNKKGNIYKSYLNGLTGKIANVGDENTLMTTIAGLKNRYNSISREIDNTKAKIVQQQTLASINDPNGQLQQEYSNLEQEVNIAESEYSKAKSFFDLYYKNNRLAEPDLDSIMEKIQEQESIKEVNETSKINNRTSMTVLVNDIKNLNENIEKDTVQIEKIKLDVKPELETEMKNIENYMNEVKVRFNQLGIKDPKDISHDGIQQVLRILKQFIETIDSIYESLTVQELEEFGNIMQNDISILSIIDQKTQLARSLESDKTKYLSMYEAYSKDLDIINELDNRPEKCKINTCPFISNSLKLLKEYGSKDSLVKSMEDIYHKATVTIVEEIDALEKSIEVIKKYLPMSTSLDRITTGISSNYEIFNKIGVITPLLDFNSLYKRIGRGDRFNEIRNNNDLLYIANDIIEYKSKSEVYSELSIAYNKHLSAYESLKLYEKNIEDNNKILQQKYEERDTLTKDYNFINNIIDRTNNTIGVLNELYNRKADELNKQSILSSKKQELLEIQKKFEGSADVIKVISELQIQLESLQNELEPIENQKKDIESRLLLLDSYRKEYNEYSEKYEIINTLKKHSSPTAGGIQTFFMNLYMGKTLELANQLLGKLFNGQYQLLEYVITPEEFRMPFVGSGLVVDDITSGSTSQVCIMGMIINLSLLNQASTKFNITRLDEIDGGLDYNNRGAFIAILQEVIELLGIEQLFIISHNMESYNGGTDAIVLAPIDGLDDNSNGSNIIYHY